MRTFPSNSPACAGLPADHTATHRRGVRRPCEQRDAGLLPSELKAMVPEYRERPEDQERALTKNLASLSRALEFNSQAARAEPGY